jgi:hypothetical protein
MLVILLVLNGLFFSLTNPDHVNSMILIIGFIILTILFYAIIDSLLFLLIKSGISLSRPRRIAVFTAILSGLILALQSIGQLSLIDLAVIIPLWMLLYLYTTYIRPHSNI